MRGRPKTTWSRMVEKEKQGGVDELGSSQSNGMEQAVVLVRKRDGLICLLL